MAPRSPELPKFSSELLKGRACSLGLTPGPAPCQPRASSLWTGSHPPLHRNLKMPTAGAQAGRVMMHRMMENYTAAKIMRQLRIHWFRIISQLCCLAKSKMQNGVSSLFFFLRWELCMLVYVISLSGRIQMWALGCLGEGNWRSRGHDR